MTIHGGGELTRGSGDEKLAAAESSRVARVWLGVMGRLRRLPWRFYRGCGDGERKVRGSTCHGDHGEGRKGRGGRKESERGIKAEAVTGKVLGWTWFESVSGLREGKKGRRQPEKGKLRREGRKVARGRGRCRQVGPASQRLGGGKHARLAGYGVGLGCGPRRGKGRAGWAEPKWRRERAGLKERKGEKKGKVPLPSLNSGPKAAL